MKGKRRVVLSVFAVCTMAASGGALQASAAESVITQRVDISDADSMLRTVPGYYKCTADVLNVRSGPGTGYSVLGTLSYGRSIYVTSISNGWAKFDFFGTPGYVKADYLREFKG